MDINMKLEHCMHCRAETSVKDAYYCPECGRMYCSACGKRYGEECKRCLLPLDRFC